MVLDKEGRRKRGEDFLLHAYPQTSAASLSVNSQALLSVYSNETCCSMLHYVFFSLSPCLCSNACCVWKKPGEGGANRTWMLILCLQSFFFFSLSLSLFNACCCVLKKLLYSQDRGRVGEQNLRVDIMFPGPMKRLFHLLQMIIIILYSTPKFHNHNMMQADTQTAKLL